MNNLELKYNNDNLFIKKSQIHGYGVFTKSKILKDTKIISCRYAVVPSNVFKNNGLEYNKNEIDFMMYKRILSMKEYICVLPIYNDIYVILLGVPSFINNSMSHEKSNTIGVLSENYEINLDFDIYATKDIEANEELLIFYNIDQNDQRFKSNFIQNQTSL
jgi:SET domain-containing protein